MTTSTPYATRYPTTLSQDEQALADEAHGRHATPVLHKDLSALGLVKANCPKKERSRLFTFRLFSQLKP